MTPGLVGDGPDASVSVWAPASAAGEAASLAASRRPRATRSPAWNRGPRSGKLRDWSNGIHLRRKGLVSKNTARVRGCVIADAPKVVEVVRERPLEEAVKAGRDGCGVDLFRRVEEVFEALEVRLRRAVALVVFAAGCESR